MPDSSEGSAHPNAVSSMSMLGESQGARSDLDNTQEPDLGEVIRKRIEDAEKEGDTELAQFFREVQQQDAERTRKAKSLLGQR